MTEQTTGAASAAAPQPHAITVEYHSSCYYCDAALKPGASAIVVGGYIFCDWDCAKAQRDREAELSETVPTGQGWEPE